MVASASFDFLRWVRESWAAFRESGWNIFSFFDLGLEGPAMVTVLRRVWDAISMSPFWPESLPAWWRSTCHLSTTFATPLVGHQDG